MNFINENIWKQFKLLVKLQSSPSRTKSWLCFPPVSSTRTTRTPTKIHQNKVFYRLGILSKDLTHKFFSEVPGCSLLHINGRSLVPGGRVSSSIWWGWQLWGDGEGQQVRTCSLPLMSSSAMWWSLLWQLSRACSWYISRNWTFVWGGGCSEVVVTEIVLSSLWAA